MFCLGFGNAIQTSRLLNFKRKKIKKKLSHFCGILMTRSIITTCTTCLKLNLLCKTSVGLDRTYVCMYNRHGNAIESGRTQSMLIQFFY